LPPMWLLPKIIFQSLPIALVGYTITFSMASILAKKGNYNIRANQEAAALVLNIICFVSSSFIIISLGHRKHVFVVLLLCSDLGIIIQKSSAARCRRQNSNGQLGCMCPAAFGDAFHRTIFPTPTSGDFLNVIVNCQYFIPIFFSVF
jgi:hypothetical protein